MAVCHQEKLRDERKKEYNLFLKEQEGLKSGVSKRQSSLPSKVGENDTNPTTETGLSESESDILLSHLIVQENKSNILRRGSSTVT